MKIWVLKISCYIIILWNMIKKGCLNKGKRCITEVPLSMITYYAPKQIKRTVNSAIFTYLLGVEVDLRVAPELYGARPAAHAVMSQQLHAGVQRLSGGLVLVVQIPTQQDKINLEKNKIKLMRDNVFTLLLRFPPLRC